MNDASKGLQRSALVMKISGRGLIVGLTGGLFLYPYRPSSTRTSMRIFGRTSRLRSSWQ
jgi:hypothetical protein